MTTRLLWVPLLGTSLLLAASACGKSEDHPAPTATKPAAPATEILVNPKPGQPLEFTFTIQQQDVAADGSRVLQVNGTYKGAEVGLIVALGAKWDSVAPDPKSKFAFHTGTVEYRNNGAPSNTLLEVIDDLFATDVHPLGLRAVTKFSGTSIEGDPAALATGEVRIKLALESADPAKQVELYTKIDLPNHQLRISEKDVGFRKALVEALKQD